MTPVLVVVVSVMVPFVVRLGFVWWSHYPARFDSALTVLPRRKHVATIIKFALFEYKHCDSPELGRTMFEGLISSEPKRIDIWNVYIDQEASSGALAWACAACAVG